jgi:hypothetical protein
MACDFVSQDEIRAPMPDGPLDFIRRRVEV